MSTPPASFLRLHVESLPDTNRPLPDAVPGLSNLCRAFESATGWRLSCEPAAESHHAAEPVWSAPLADGRDAQLCLRRKAGRGASIDTANASRLAAAIGELISGRIAAETAVWHREAELASCVPVVTRPDESAHLAQRLQAILKAGAEAIGCQAAGLYLLDADTTQLKLRSIWGLPRTGLLQPPRLLASALADLEALAGHAVVLEKAALADVWSLPEPFPAAVCVPVSTPTVPLGTLWLFSELERPFSDAEVNLTEIVAGRLAAELEREILLENGQQSKHLSRQLDRAHDLQASASLRTSPLIEHWDLAGWVVQAQRLGGAHFDWSVDSKRSVVCSLGEACGGGIASAMVSQTVRAAVAAHVEHGLELCHVLSRVSQALWRHSCGDQLATLCLAELSSTSGRVRCAWSGAPALLHVRKQTYDLWYQPAGLLGQEVEATATQREFHLQRGEVLVLCTPSLAAVLQQPGHRLNTATLAMLLMDHLEASAANLSELIRSCSESQALDLDQADRGVVVIKAT